MKRNQIECIALVIVPLATLTVIPDACGAPILSLSSSDDLSHLTPGQTVTIDVDLSGLAAGDEIEFLLASVVFDASTLGTPTISPGPIVPEPGDFDVVELPGLADGIYDSVFGGAGSLLPIMSNGTFFSFEVTVAAAGSGQIALDFVDSIGFDSLFDPLPTAATDPTAGSLSFQSISPAAVPEPTSLIVWSLGIATLIGFGRLLPTRRRCLHNA